MISFFVEGRPVAKGRPRATKNVKTEVVMTRYGAAFSRGNVLRVYTPKKTIMAEADVLNAFLNKYHPDKATCPLRMDVYAFFRPPASASRSRREAMIAGEAVPGDVGDVDNLLKLVMDALEGYAYKNDSQIASGHVWKRYGMREGVQVDIDRLNVIGGNK